MDKPIDMKDFLEAAEKKYINKATQNGRSLKPWTDHPQKFLIERLAEEFTELIDACVKGNSEAIKDECLDVANFAWFLYEQATATTSSTN